MKRYTYSLALALACAALLVWGGKIIAAESANAAGTWEMSFEGPRGTMTRALTIQQDGSTIKGTLEGRRGEAPLEGSVQGNKISFTVKRETPRGTMTLQYNGTIDGDSMKGTVEGGRFNGNWTAKRAKSASEK
jgi:hypothetical protein